MSVNPGVKGLASIFSVTTPLVPTRQALRTTSFKAAGPSMHAWRSGFVPSSSLAAVQHKAKREARIAASVEKFLKPAGGAKSRKRRGKTHKKNKNNKKIKTHKKKKGNK